MSVFCMLLIKSRILRGQSEYHLTAPQPFNLQLSLKTVWGWCCYLHLWFSGCGCQTNVWHCDIVVIHSCLGNNSRTKLMGPKYNVMGPKYKQNSLYIYIWKNNMTLMLMLTIKIWSIGISVDKWWLGFLLFMVDISVGETKPTLGFHWGLDRNQQVIVDTSANKCCDAQ